MHIGEHPSTKGLDCCIEKPGLVTKLTPLLHTNPHKVAIDYLTAL